MEVKEGIALKDYIYAVGNIVKPTNIRFASKISNNRICLYLASEELVKEITSNYKQVQVGNHSVDIRPLITKHLRVVLSNVSPTIPHSFIEDTLDRIQIRRGSSVSFLRAGMSEPGYSQILSFRRQVYIYPEDSEKLPESLQLQYDDTPYWIYLSTDALKCFLCKENGHVAKNCPNTTDSNSMSQNEKDTTKTITVTQENKETESQSVEPGEESHSKVTSTEIDKINPKRTRSTISSVDSTSSKDPLTNKTNSNARKPCFQETRRLKTMPAEKSIEEILEPVKEILDEQNKLLNFVQTKSLLENVFGSSNPQKIVSEYTTDIDGLISFLKNDIYPRLLERSIKNRITRLIKKLSSNTNLTLINDATPATSDDE